MTALTVRSAALSPAIPALRPQRIIARLRERASDKGIAEGPSRERVRRIVRGATARGKAAHPWPGMAPPFPLLPPAGEEPAPGPDPGVARPPSPGLTRGLIPGGRMWRRKSLQRLDWRPEMAPRLARRSASPRPAVIDPRWRGKCGSPLQGGPCGRAVRHQRTSSGGAHCLRRWASKDARWPPGADGTPSWEFFLIWIARNPLKSPESDEGIQENPSPLSWSGLVWLWFGLEEFGLEAFREAASAGGNGVAKE